MPDYAAIAKAQFDSETQKANFADIPFAELMQKVYPHWMGYSPETPPIKEIFTYGQPNFTTTNVPQGVTHGLGNYPSAVGLQQALFNDALKDDQSKGAFVAMHEAAHVGQGARGNFLAQPEKSTLAAFPLKQLLSPYATYSSLSSPIEREADLMASMMQNLLQVKKQNDFETSIGVRPH